MKKIIYRISGILILLLFGVVITSSVLNNPITALLDPFFSIPIIIIGYILGDKIRQAIENRNNNESVDNKKEKTSLIDFLFGLLGIVIALIISIIFTGGMIILFGVFLIPGVVLVGYVVGKYFGKLMREYFIENDLSQKFLYFFLFFILIFSISFLIYLEIDSSKKEEEFRSKLRSLSVEEQIGRIMERDLSKK